MPSLLRGSSVPYFASLLYSFIILGLNVSIIGPSLLSLASQTGASIQQSSFLFSARTLGFLSGTVIGGLVIDRFPHRGNTALAFYLLFQSILPAFIPSISNFALLLFVLILYGIVLGGIDNCAQVLLIRHFGSSVAPFMNALHAFFGIGAWLAPLILAPFLPADHSLALGDENSPESIAAYEAGARNKDWHYGYYIVACAALPGSIAVARFALKEGKVDDSQSESTTQTEISDRPTEVHLTPLELEYDSVLVPQGPESTPGETPELIRYKWRVVAFVSIFLFFYVGENYFNFLLLKHSLSERQSNSVAGDSIMNARFIRSFQLIFLSFLSFSFFD